MSHLRRCKDGKSRKPAQPLTFDLGEELEACEIHGVHVRGGPPRAENAIALRPTNQLTQTSQHLVFHQHKHRSRLVGVASDVMEQNVHVTQTLTAKERTAIYEES